MMDWLIAIQRWLYGGLADGMKSSANGSGLPGLVAAAFLFGIVHALMPGHGKSTAERIAVDRIPTATAQLLA